MFFNSLTSKNGSNTGYFEYENKAYKNNYGRLKLLTPMSEAQIQNHMCGGAGTFDTLIKEQIKFELKMVQASMLNMCEVEETATHWELNETRPLKQRPAKYKSCFTIKGKTIFKVGNEIYLDDVKEVFATVENDKPVMFFKRTAKKRKELENGQKVTKVNYTLKQCA